MSRSLNASDRSSLIKLASDLPKGSPERKAILAGLKKAGSLVKVIVYGGKAYDYTAEEIQEMLKAPGVLADKYKSADNLPKWLWGAGAAKEPLEISDGKIVYVPNPYAKNFPGGGWPTTGKKGWEQVGQILQDILESGRPVTLNVRSDDRASNGLR